MFCLFRNCIFIRYVILYICRRYVLTLSFRKVSRLAAVVICEDLELHTAQAPPQPAIYPRLCRWTAFVRLVSLRLVTPARPEYRLMRFLFGLADCYSSKGEKRNRYPLVKHDDTVYTAEGKADVFGNCMEEQWAVSNPTHDAEVGYFLSADISTLLLVDPPFFYRADLA